MTLGLILLIGGVAFGALVVAAAANNPTGNLSGAMFVFASGVAGLGLVLVLASFVGWLV